MGRRTYSDDIRGLVVKEVAAGASRRSAALRFKVSRSSAIRWVDRHEATGSVSPQKGASRVRRWDPHTAWLLDLIAGEPDLTLAEIAQRLLAERGVPSIHPA